MNEEANSAYRSKLQRAELLCEQKRYAEAEKYLQGAISDQPENPDGYYQMGLCYCNWDDHAKEALRFIDRAISLAPNRSEFLSLRAWVLVNLNQHRKAIET